MDSSRVVLRLNGYAWARYSAEAGSKGVSLAVHLRTRLEQQDELLGEISALRRAIERVAANAAEEESPVKQPVTPEQPVTPGALVEILLLLRTVVGPQRAIIAQKEVERRGLEIWK
ncbi:MAG TPA: hypothetical protein VMK12_32455 [Anaeromyxobacteraceae bacterium]|nr:hypothetical protein [Anaeromyxobacteraceae bacterium]